MAGDVADADEAAGAGRERVVVVAADLARRHHLGRQLQLRNRDRLGQQAGLDARANLQLFLQALLAQ